MPNSPDDFEVVDTSSVEFAKRGRKSNIDPQLVAKLATLKPKQALRVGSLKVDMKSADYKTEKARVSAQLRNAARSAGLAKFDIRWTLDGTPTVCC